MIRGVLLALLLLVGVACQSEPEPRQGGPSSRPVTRGEAKDPSSSSDPGAAPAPRELAPINASILVKAILYHYERDRFEDQGYRCQFQVAEVIRGELDQHTERNFTTNLGTMRGNFPWIKNQEYAGAVVFLHLDRQRGELKILGFSETATGEVVPYS